MCEHISHTFPLFRFASVQSVLLLSQIFVHSVYSVQVNFVDGVSAVKVYFVCYVPV